MKRAEEEDVMVYAIGADPVSTFARVAEELHHQYSLGFTPVKLDGKMHTLQVRVSTEGLTVRARKSYLAKTGG